ncbi:sigma factor-like helix-turn-helix DNA-binding protein [Frigoriglobus tundricola]|uniref:RNA polymerase sigma factor 70 region 4 type 2 domain-containing protein n=1 Tax=Frigoriglobus tundricola TaxID=2774151 RepID=A0A6M5YIY3_9BACT|nr:sigma factor-like helix-turn-helix DNA-binding protein [Frigoriglobus tundricola]QJW93291.1 hypothetical protein FTUN_0797 [Frigoriglobus tundricola]
MKLSPVRLPDRPAAAVEPDDTAAVVDAEIANLPAIFRSAVLLCEIEGVSRADAAVRLGIHPGTLSSRLAAARKLLAGRLRRRGVGAVTGLGTAVVPEALARAAASRADGRASGTVLKLSQGVRTMLDSKLMLTAAVACVALAGSLFAMNPAARVAPGTPQPQRAPEPATKGPAAKKPAEWKVLFTLKHTHRVAAVAACADLIVAAADTGGEKDYVRFWNASDGTASDLEITPLGFSVPVRFNFLRFTTDGTHLIVGTEHSGTRYRRRPGGLAADILDSYDLLACSADMNTLLVRKDHGAFKDPKPNRLYLHVNPWAVPENFLKKLAVFDEDCEAITHADVSADDQRIAIAGDDAVVRVYNRNNLKLLHKVTLPKQTKVTAVRLSDGGRRLAVVGEKGFAKLFDDAGKEVCDLKGHEGTIAAVAFAPDGKRVVTASGKVARIFDATNGKRVGELIGHEDLVTAVAFSSDGKRMVTGSADQTAKVWESQE